MNDDKIKSQTIKPIAGNAIPTSEDHPLHILDNQTDPSKKPRKFDVPQKPVRTFEKDLEEEMARLEAAGTPANKPKSSFFSFTKKEEPQVLEKIVVVDKIPNKTVNTEDKPRFYVDRSALNKEENPIENIGKGLDLNNKYHSFTQPSIKTYEKDIEQVEQLVPKINTPVFTKSFEDTIEDSHNRQKEYIEKEKLVQSIIKPQEKIKTYESDVSDSIKTNNTSVISMALAENQRKEENGMEENVVESHWLKKTIIVFASIMLIIGGSYGGYYLYTISPLAVVPIKKENKIFSIVTPDYQKIVTTSATNRLDLTKFISDQLANSNFENDKMTEYIINRKLASSTVRIKGAEIIGDLGFNITDTLKRSLKDNWMMGVYSVNVSNGEVTTSKKIPFVILTTDFFQNAFAGMLKWETSMPDDFADIFGYRQIASLSNTASTSSYFSSNIRGSFKDKIVMNRDVRQFSNLNGEILLIYTFIDKNTILITTSEATIPSILNRIEKQTYVR